MAIAFDSSLNNASSSFSFTNTAGDFMALLVGTTSATHATATYNGVALIWQSIQEMDVQSNWIQFLTLVAPATGSNTISITGAGVSASVATYSGTRNFTQPEVLAQASASASSISNSITTVTNNSWVIMGVGANGQPSGYTNATARASNTFPYLADSNGPVTPAGAFSQTATIGGGAAPLAMLQMAIPPRSTQTTGASFLMKLI